MRKDGDRRDEKRDGDSRDGNHDERSRDGTKMLVVAMETGW